MRVYIVILTWLLVVFAFVLTTCGGYLLPGLLCGTSLIIRFFLHRHGFSVTPNGLILTTCMMWWSAQIDFTTPLMVYAAKSGAVAMFLLLSITGIIGDIRRFRLHKKSESEVHAA
jgi:hypothetical protein